MRVKYNDRADGGNSRIDWPEELAWDDWDLFAPIVEECKGICGTFTLDQGSLDYKPFVGLGFDIAGTKLKKLAFLWLFGLFCIIFRM